MFGLQKKPMNIGVQKKDTSEDIFDNEMMSMLFDIMMLMMFAAMAESLLHTNTTAAAASPAEAQQLSGQTDSRVLNAIPTLQWISLISGPPYVPWNSVSIHNDGLTVNGVILENSAFVGINDPVNLQEVMYDESYNINLASSKGITAIFYRSPNGASLRAVGKY